MNSRHEPLEIHGIVHHLTPTRLLLTTRHGEIRLITDESTIIVIDGVIANPAELVIDERVKVNALPLADESLLALLVVAELEELELAGSILCLTEGALTLEAAKGIYDVGLTDDTVVRIFGHDGSISDLRVGMHVEVRAERLADDRLIALVIRVEDDFDLIDLEGVIVAVSLTELVLLPSRGTEVTVARTPRTFVMRQGEPIPMSALQAGDHVGVKAFREPDESIVALRIKVEDP